MQKKESNITNNSSSLFVASDNASHLLWYNNFMALSPTQQLEMYSDIKVIKNNCLMCKKLQDDHEKRLKNLERGYWQLVGVCTFLAFIIPLVLSFFLKV